MALSDASKKQVKSQVAELRQRKAKLEKEQQKKERDEQRRKEAEARRLARQKVSPIKLVAHDTVNPSTYNPRISDPERLDMIELSLRKLGFLLPLFADKSGELSSGHQRHLVAGRMGVKMIPVRFFQSDLPIQKRKALNIIFNRATNDMDITVTSARLTERLKAADIHKLAEKVPDKKIGEPEFYRCMNPEMMPIQPLLKANSGEWVTYARNITWALRKYGVMMPIIIDPDLKVVNGIGRLEYLAETHAEEVPVIRLSYEEAALAEAMLNYLTMDFDIKSRFADYLRHNSFRRSRVTPPQVHMGYGFTFVVMPNEHPDRFFLTNPEHITAWEREHGRSILDFGAGRMKEVKNLRQAGFDVDAFEPYVILEGDTIDHDASVKMNSQFLDVAASGKQWDSIFLTAVMNSVPFFEDRVHIVRILAGLAQNATVYSSAVSNRSGAWKNYMGRKGLDKTSQSDHGFILDYEPNMKLGDLLAAPKAQKYHSMEEWEALWNLFFEEVKTGYYMSQVVTVICRKPKPIDRCELAKSLDFEFDLPYPGDLRMGLAKKARWAFGQRLGIDFEDC
ncbi:MAG: hypothetical protein FOGNACKC_00897 [Anaerolineae bacterium]|nr:hypothetical protein [Anaerolineae bacterium]